MKYDVFIDVISKAKDVLTQTLNSKAYFKSRSKFKLNNK